MSELPRLLAYLDATVVARDDLDRGFEAIASLGGATAIVARHPGATADQLTRLTTRAVEAARPHGALVFTSGRSDIARACGGNGVVLRRGDLPAREIADSLIALASVHDIDEAKQAVAEGAHGLIVGTIWPSRSHPGRDGVGTGLISATATLGLPVYAIGGITPERARQAVKAGAWGVAAIGAIWRTPDAGQAARTLLESLAEATRFKA